jgi:hypothetical protein
MIVPLGSVSRYSTDGLSAWTAVTNVEATPVGVTVAVVLLGPTPHALTAATEKVAEEPPPKEPRVALVADGAVAVDSPTFGPLAARTTYPVSGLPLPLAAVQLTVA